MKFSTTLTLLAGLAILSSTPVCAAPVSFTPGSDLKPASLEADLSTQRIANLILPKAQVELSGDAVSVGVIPDWLFDRHVVLTGVLVRSDVANSGNKSLISGLCYFNEGEWLGNLGPASMGEKIGTAGGELLIGRIQNLDDHQVSIILSDGTHKTIPFFQVRSISSPRAYNFEIASSSMKISPTTGDMTGEATTISFTPSAAFGISFHHPSTPKSRLPGLEGGITKTEIGAMVAVDALEFLAPAIEAPILFTLPTHHSLVLLNHFDSTAAATVVGTGH